MQSDRSLRARRFQHRPSRRCTAKSLGHAEKVVHRLALGRLRGNGLISQPGDTYTKEAQMSTTTAQSKMPSVQWLIESRPPSLTWARPARSQPNQPPLDLVDHQPDYAEVAAPNNRGVRATTVKARWAARPRPGLPNAEEWSATLALAIIQALLGQRPAAQLNRWVGEEVLAAISLCQRRSLRAPGRVAIPIALRSVRVQHPGREVAEVAAHVVIGRQSAAMAFRLEAIGDRWLCTALELGARWSGISSSD
jgi:hypothetical protein